DVASGVGELAHVDDEIDGDEVAGPDDARRRDLPRDLEVLIPGERCRVDGLAPARGDRDRTGDRLDREVGNLAGDEGQVEGLAGLERDSRSLPAAHVDERAGRSDRTRQ